MHSVLEGCVLKVGKVLNGARDKTSEGSQREGDNQN